MELVIDANVLMSALIATEGKTYDMTYSHDLKVGVSMQWHDAVLGS